VTTRLFIIPKPTYGRWWARAALIILLSALGACGDPSTQPAGERITIAVAANFAKPMQALVQAFEQRSPHRVHIAIGSSGKFFAQIQQGAPFHAFFSADQAKPLALLDGGHALPQSQFTYAVGRLVLWSAKVGQAGALATQLKDQSYQKLALANPDLAPYGRAAVDVITNLNLLATSREHWVQGENVAQAYQFVVTGNADLGFVALSQISEHGQIMRGSAWLVPDHLYQPIRQDAVTLAPGANSPATQQLLAFVRSQAAQGIMADYGYRPSPH